MNKKEKQMITSKKTKVKNSFSNMKVRLPIIVINMLLVVLFAGMPVFAADILTNASQMVSDVYAKLLGMSTAAAGVGVGTGALMKKFSMGKQDKIELGGKIMKDSIIGWSVLNGLTSILAFLGPYLGNTVSA